MSAEIDENVDVIVGDDARGLRRRFIDQIAPNDLIAFQASGDGVALGRLIAIHLKVIGIKVFEEGLDEIGDGVITEVGRHIADANFIMVDGCTVDRVDVVEEGLKASGDGS